jgi:hypothetical protein
MTCNRTGTDSAVERRDLNVRPTIVDETITRLKALRGTWLDRAALLTYFLTLHTSASSIDVSLMAYVTRSSRQDVEVSNPRTPDTTYCCYCYSCWHDLETSSIETCVQLLYL